MGGGCCAVGHIPGAQDGICYICHSQIHAQDANTQYRPGLPPRQQTTGRPPHWTQIVNHILSASTQEAADTDDGDSDDAEWLMSVHGNRTAPGRIAILHRHTQAHNA